jgi:hypothetical protein
MPRGRPRKNPDDVLIRSAELIGWALGGIEREIIETRNKLASLTAQAAQLRNRVGAKGTRGQAASTPNTTAAAAMPVEAAEPAEQGNGRRRRRRRMSPEARKRISEMMKKRWAERKRSK